MAPDKPEEMVLGLFIDPDTKEMRENISIPELVRVETENELPEGMAAFRLPKLLISLTPVFAGGFSNIPDHASVFDMLMNLVDGAKVVPDEIWSTVFEDGHPLLMRSQGVVFFPTVFVTTYDPSNIADFEVKYEGVLDTSKLSVVTRKPKIFTPAGTVAGSSGIIIP